MCEVSEGDITFLYDVKLVSLGDLGSIVHLNILKIQFKATVFTESIGTNQSGTSH
jgi:hypothetical protein